MKVSQNFYLQEFVSKDVYTKWGDNAIWFVDRKVINITQFLRERFGVTTVNNWMDGGQYNYSGFREPECTVGAKLSSHRFGRAADTKFRDKSELEVYQDIVTNFDLYKKYGLTTVENIKMTTKNKEGWVHFDTRWTNKEELLIVNP